MVQGGRVYKLKKIKNMFKNSLFFLLYFSIISTFHKDYVRACLDGHFGVLHANVCFLNCKTFIWSLSQPCNIVQKYMSSTQ